MQQQRHQSTRLFGIEHEEAAHILGGNDGRSWRDQGIDGAVVEIEAVEIHELLALCLQGGKHLVN